MIGETKEIKCKCGCGRKKEVRIADVKRGWGKFYSKSCKAKWQENKTGQYSKYLRKEKAYANNEDYNEPECWDEHKDY